MFNSKKGISGVITAVIMIALVITATSIIWTIVNNLVKDKLEEAGSCFDTFEKIEINNRYTCYDTDESETHVSIEVKDISLTAILISISDKEGNSKSFKLSDTALTENYLKDSGGTYGGQVLMPEKNSGKTYILNTDLLGIGYPSLIQVAPISGGKQCEVADTLAQIDDCKSLVS